MTLEEALPFLVPLILLQLVLLVFGIYDLTRPERRVKGDNKWIWALIIVIGQIPGTLIYFMLGREDS
jgi:Phospholipase_D-nuclease N-terminal